MKNMLRFFFATVLFQIRASGGHSTHPCNHEDYHNVQLQELSSALGDDVTKPSAQIKLVDLILKGFDCKSRLAHLSCQGKTLTCVELRNQILGISKPGLNVTYLPMRLFATALKLESFACHDGMPQNNSAIKQHLHLHEFCTSRDYVHFRNIFKTIFHNTVALWRPELIRPEVWKTNSTNSEFVNQRKCIQKWPLLHYLVPRARSRRHSSHNSICMGTPLLLEKMMIRMLARLLQGNQLVKGGSRCPIDYVLDIFKVFGHHHNHTKCDDMLYMTTSDMDRLLHNTESRDRLYRHGSPPKHASKPDDHFEHPEHSHWPEYDKEWSHDRHDDEKPSEHHQPKHHQPKHHHSHNDVKRSVWEELEERRTNQRSRNMHMPKWIPYPIYMKHMPGPTIANAAQIMKTFFHKTHYNISVKAFHEVCPALLHHVLFASSTFVRHRPRPTTLKPDPTNRRLAHTNLTSLKHIATSAEVYGYGSLSVLLISLCSLVGAVFVRISQGEVRHYIMAGMLALGMGNLCGDAVLHLIPEVITADKMGDGDNDADDQIMLLGNSNISRRCVKMLAMLGSMYAFFVLELVMSLYHDHSHESEIEVTIETSKPKKTLSRVSLMKYSKTTSSEYLSTIFEDGLETPSSSSSDPGAMEIQQAEETIKTVKKTSSLQSAVPRSVAWMVIIGDSMHNFADGLAIGASFSLGITPGISTSIAVICHELPHELGDFAVLVSTGMSVRRALWLNFVSSLTAFIGLYIGISAGSQDTARHWIFSVGAGMFLYVALADLIPELLRYFKRFQNWAMFLVQNVGILAGYAIMLIIAIYEDEINL